MEREKALEAYWIDQPAYWESSGHYFTMKEGIYLSAPAAWRFKANDENIIEPWFMGPSNNSASDRDDVRPTHMLQIYSVQYEIIQGPFYPIFIFLLNWFLFQENYLIFWWLSIKPEWIIKPRIGNPPKVNKFPINLI